jgi:plastocyanin
MPRLAVLLVAMLSVPPAVPACGRDGGGVRTVRIHVFAFAPDSIRIARGVTVTWVNDDEIVHTVTSPVFDHRLDGAGARFSYTFRSSGTYRYVCSRHQGMAGAVTIR